MKELCADDANVVKHCCLTCKAWADNELDEQLLAAKAENARLKKEIETCESDKKTVGLKEKTAYAQSCDFPEPYNSNSFFGTVVNNLKNAGVIADQSELCYRSVEGGKEFVVKANGKMYPTCVGYSENNAQACPATLNCDQGNSAQVGWAGHQSKGVELALRRNNKMHPRCPSYGQECLDMDPYMTGTFLRDMFNVQQEDLWNLCYSQTTKGARFVTEAGIVEMCLGSHHLHTNSCPAERHYMCSHSNAGKPVYGYPKQQAYLLKEALMNSDKVHPFCPFPKV